MIFNFTLLFSGAYTRIFSQNRSFSLYCGMRFLTLLLMATGLFQSATSAGPNFLFIVADDLNCALGPYEDKAAVTPNLDRLAARGITYQNAYCQQAVCNPSRSSFLTGLRPDTVGVDDLRKYFRDTAPNGHQLITLPQHFKNHRYFCQNIGKMFHNMGDTKDRRSWSIDESFFEGTHSADTIFYNAVPDGEKPLYKSPVTEAYDVPDTAYRDGQIGNLAAAMLKEHATSSQPFFLAVGFWRPHLPFVAPKKYWDLYKENEIPMPASSGPPEDAPEIALYDSKEIKGYGLVPKDREFTEDEIRHYRHGYYASISFLDAQVGKILDALDESGKADETIVIFTSDHGFHIGEHAQWGKTSNFELDARVPLIISHPGKPSEHGKDSTALFELVDLYPTMADLGGIRENLPENLEGVSLAHTVADASAKGKEVALSQHQHPFYVKPKDWKSIGYSMRTDRYRYTEWRPIDGEGAFLGIELYDHREDPHETKNLAYLPEQAELVAKLKSQLATQLEK